MFIASLFWFGLCLRNSGKQMHPLVSVLMSCYNAEKTIDEAINSLLLQSYKNIEYIFINDGSTDKTLSIIQSFNDHRITVISHENKGIVESLNIGLKRCTGKYIARMDADDISKPDRIAKQVEFLEQRCNISASGGIISEFNENGFIKLTTKPSEHIDLLFYSLHRTPISNPTSMIRRSILTENNIEYDPIYRYSQDAKLWLEIAKVGQLANQQELFLDYRQSSEQVTKKHRQEQKSLASDVRKDTYQFLKESLNSLDPISPENQYHYFRYLVESDFTLSKLSKIKLLWNSSLVPVKKLILIFSAMFKTSGPSTSDL